ncbi:hypothetical protein, partial [Aeromonas hydrophila]|uniref:hypothetical protein n=1 Tax=Aeromonas hydrophila TaxID=644 RepID=UPI0036D9CC1E
LHQPTLTALRRSSYLVMHLITSHIYPTHDPIHEKGRASLSHQLLTLSRIGLEETDGDSDKSHDQQPQHRLDRRDIASG